MKVTPELARIHGHICGDGSVYMSVEKRSTGALLKHKRKNVYRNVWRILYYNTSKELVNEFICDFDKAFGRKCQYRSKYHEVRISGTKNIIKMMELDGKNSYNWNIPNFILNSHKRIICNWLRAFFDDEGHVPKNRNSIIITSVNIDGLKQISDMLKKVGIVSRLRGPYKSDKERKHKDFWRLIIPKKYLSIYHNKIGFTHSGKNRLLNSKLGKAI